MDIRFVRSEDQAGVGRVLSYCFQLSDSFFDWVWENSQDDFLAAFTPEGTIAACLAIYPFQVKLAQKKFKMGGIGLVGTLPEYRHSHYASQTLIQALQIMRERGQYLSMLGPFSHQYYRRYGWEVTYTMKNYTLMISSLQGFGTGQGSLRPLTKKDLPAVQEVYDTYSAGYMGVLDRDLIYWERRWSKPGKEYERYGYFDQEGRLTGYLFYRLENRVFLIEEMRYQNLAAKKEMLGFIYKHRAQVNEVHWAALPPDDQTFLLLSDQVGNQSLNIPGKMTRIVDVQGFLEDYPFPDEIGAEFTLEVEDGVAEWNDQVFQVTIQQGQTTVSPVETDSSDLSCSVQVLAQILLGFIGLEDAWRLEKIQGDPQKIAELGELFPKQTPYLDDRF